MQATLLQVQQKTKPVWVLREILHQCCMLLFGIGAETQHQSHSLKASYDHMHG